MKNRRHDQVAGTGQGRFLYLAGVGAAVQDHRDSGHTQQWRQRFPQHFPWGTGVRPAQFRLQEPSPEIVARARVLTNAEIPRAEVWRALWEESRLLDREVRTFQIDPRTEVKSRLRWAGGR